MSRLPIALQLYTVREQLAADFKGTVQQVGQMGYGGVELAGYGGLNGAELRSLLNSCGLLVAGDHVAFNRLENELDEVVKLSKALGNTAVVCPSSPPQRRADLAGWKSLAASFNEIGKRLAGEGLEFCYHNHAFEFETIGVTDGFHVLFDTTNPALVKIELDTFWVKKAGSDPVSIMQQYPGRIPLIHLKDMTNDEERTFAEVGEGTMDFHAIFGAAATAGARWYIVEQDRCRRPPLESAALSLKHLQDWGMA
ncbi:MAG: sugar phosphate isomerase/epimerase [Chloroflexi bacterium]|nr:sugar phosphate isomerase/epimerase [Chloroflexota bacterium]